MLAVNQTSGVGMSGRDEIRDVILGAAEGATGSVQAMAAIGCSAAVEDFDVEVQSAPDGAGGADLTAVVRFSLVVSQIAEARRSVA